MLRAFWKGWLAIAKKIGHFQSQLILALVYFIVVAPFALAVRIFKDPLNRRGGASWHRLSQDHQPTLDRVKRQS
jgi:saxitoxin biosynthesis operon SxtJ-like protein